MIKLLSFKTRRPDLTSEALRSHYEESHVPLGLSFIEHFRWRKYVRNYVASPALGHVDFDCMTEFWVSGRADQERTAEFVASPEFSVLDEDDRRFLDVTKRLSFEVEERLFSGSKPGSHPSDTHRLAMFIAKPRAMPAAEFADDMVERVRRFAARHVAVCDRIALDLRRPDSPETGGIHAVLSAWPSPTGGPEALAWPEIANATSVIALESVETPPEALFCGRE